MKTRSRTEVVIETHQVTLIRHSEEVIRAWCAACGAEVQMLMPERAARIAQSNVRMIGRRVEDGDLHFVETPKVCY